MTRPKGERAILRINRAAATLAATSRASVASGMDGAGTTPSISLGIPGMPCTPLVSQRSLVTTRRTISEKPSVTMAK